MKRKLCTFWGISFLLILSVRGNPVLIEGKWEPGGSRSIIAVPAPPTVFIENGELSIYFVDTIADLAVTISEPNSVVWQDTVSGDSGNTLIIPLSPVSYRLTVATRNMVCWFESLRLSNRNLSCKNPAGTTATALPDDLSNQ